MYPPYNEVQARELIDCLREIAPYVVIDCGSYIANDILSAVALMEADSVLRLANADLKSISYPHGSGHRGIPHRGVRQAAGG